MYIHIRFTWVQVLNQHNSTTIWKFIQKTHRSIHKSTGFLKITTLIVKYLNRRHFFNYNDTCIYFTGTYFWPMFSFYTSWREGGKVRTFYTHWKPRKSNFNPFLANIPILYPLKTPENQRFFGVFRGCKIGMLANDGLTVFWEYLFFNAALNL